MRGDNTTYIRTFLGGSFWPLDPHVDDLRIEDIAHALSQLCRWTGHSKKFYSVAQHSVLVSENLPSMLQLEGLMHDASEAYLSDLSRPIKHAPGLGDVYRRVEKKIERVIAQKYGLPLSPSPAVKIVDNRLLYTEARDLMAGFVWSNESAEANETGKPDFLPFTIVPWSPERAEKEFLQRFHLLTSPSTFTTGEYAASIGLARHAALGRLKKLAARGIVERTRVSQDQGGVVRTNVVGWKFLGSNGNPVVEVGRSALSGTVDPLSEDAEVVVAGYQASG